MKSCWICNKCFDSLSREHIIPRLFEGYLITEEFSCRSCNAKLGEIERNLTQISILMQNLDNANGEPKNVIPKGESPKKERKWFYGDKPGIELSTDGAVRSDGWERPPGKAPSGDVIWRPGMVEMTVSVHDVHRSMLKAILALASHVGFPQSLFEVPLEYLAGNDEILPVIQPTSLSIPTREMFARVWIFAPPTNGNVTVYGAAIYGPLTNIYRLCADLQDGLPFCFELRAYSKHEQCHAETEGYMNWRSILLKELRPNPPFNYIGRSGIYAVRESPQSGLFVLETSPSGAAAESHGTPDLYVPIHPSIQTYGPNRRFQNWVRSAQSENEHAAFLEGAREFDEWAKILMPS